MFQVVSDTIEYRLKHELRRSDFLQLLLDASLQEKTNNNSRIKGIKAADVKGIKDNDANQSDRPTNEKNDVSQPGKLGVKPVAIWSKSGSRGSFEPGCNFASFICYFRNYESCTKCNICEFF